MDIKAAIAELEVELVESQRETDRLLALYEASRQKMGRRIDAVRVLRELQSEQDALGGRTLPGLERAAVSAEVDASTGIKEGARRTTRRHTQGDILVVMQAQHRALWSKRDLVAEFERKGWTGHMKNPEAAIGHAADRLVDDGRLIRVSPGQYALPAAERTEQRWSTDTGITGQNGASLANETFAEASIL
jgi:hypothetical protein